MTGVLVAKGQSGFGSDQDDMVMVPITTLQDRLTGQTWVSSIFVSADTAEAVPEVADATERLLRLRHQLAAAQPDDFSVRNIADLQQVRVATSQTQALLLAGIAVVSLVVGGIGIMNIMLVSVTERTREIGLRMAVGARGRDILLQFLVEALTLACLGGRSASRWGSPTIEAVAILAHWPVLVSGFSIILGFCVGARDRRGVRVLSGAAGGGARADHGVALRVSGVRSRCHVVPGRARTIGTEDEMLLARDNIQAIAGCTGIASDALELR